MTILTVISLPRMMHYVDNKHTCIHDYSDHWNNINNIKWINLIRLFTDS